MVMLFSYVFQFKKKAFRCFSLIRAVHKKHSASLTHTDEHHIKFLFLLAVSATQEVPLCRRLRSTVFKDSLLILNFHIRNISSHSNCKA